MINETILTGVPALVHHHTWIIQANCENSLLPSTTYLLNCLVPVYIYVQQYHNCSLVLGWEITLSTRAQCFCAVFFASNLRNSFPELPGSVLFPSPPSVSLFHTFVICLFSAPILSFDPSVS